VAADQRLGAVERGVEAFEHEAPLLLADDEGAAAGEVQALAQWGWKNKPAIFCHGDMKSIHATHSLMIMDRRYGAW
jgi:hypothetical protein